MLDPTHLSARHPSLKWNGRNMPFEMKHSTSPHHSQRCSPHFHRRLFHPFRQIQHFLPCSLFDHRRNQSPSVPNLPIGAVLLCRLPLFFCQSLVPHSLLGSLVPDISLTVNQLLIRGIILYESEAIKCLSEGVEHYGN